MIDFDAIIMKNNEVRRKKAAWQRLRDMATDISVHLSDMPKGGGDGRQQEREVVEMVAAEEAYQRAKAELAEMQEELREAMACLKRWQHHDVIQKRYLEGKTISQTMQEIGYEWSQTYRFISEAKIIINSRKME